MFCKRPSLLPFPLIPASRHQRNVGLKIRYWAMKHKHKRQREFSPRKLFGKRKRVGGFWIAFWKGFPPRLTIFCPQSNNSCILADVPCFPRITAGGKKKWNSNPISLFIFFSWKSDSATFLKPKLFFFRRTQAIVILTCQGFFSRCSDGFLCGNVGGEGEDPSMQMKGENVWREAEGKKASL